MAKPKDSQVSVIGGGAVGTAVAYFLAREGWKDVQLIEKHGLCDVTSSQAAGFVGQARPTPDRARLSIAAAHTYRTFEAQTGYPTDYRESGSVRLALTEESVRELEQVARTAEITGLDVEFLDDQRLSELYPVLTDTSAVRAALWCPTDGYLQPNSLVNAYASAARDLGVNIVTGCAVESIDVVDGRVQSVTTREGTVRTELVIIAAGAWAGALARSVGVELPIVPILHEYFVSEPVEGWHGDLPCLRVTDLQIYARGEGDRILCGGFERTSTSISPDSVTPTSAVRAEANWEVLAGFAEELDKLAPGTSDVGISATFKGWPTFTPDGRFVVGPVSSVQGLAMAAGCCAHGVAGSASLGAFLVESLGDDPSDYVRSLSPDRFLPRDWTWKDAERRARDLCENYYSSSSPAAVSAYSG